jgi:hypothetical protein
MRSSRITALILLFLIVFGLGLHGPFRAFGAENASVNIDQAESAVRRAFNATLEAESAGANVSRLLVELDGAGELLSMAEMAYRTGNQTEAAAEADAAISAASGIEAEASGLKSAALAEGQSVFQTDLVFSLVGAGGFLVVLCFAWVWFRRVYVRRLLRLRPEVKPDVEA